MRIAIIDSGIDRQHKRLRKCKISGIFINHIKEEQYEINGLFNDELGHGTAIAGIIHNLIPEAELIGIKVFKDQLSVNEFVIHRAINWCIENKVDIINLSLGIETNNPNEKLFQVCKKAYDINIPIIAAAHNDFQSECYPAFFPFVFGVTGGKVINKYDFGYLPESPVEFIAKGTIQRVAWKNRGYNITSGTSYACAHFTGIVASSLKKIKNIERLKKHLVIQSKAEVRPNKSFDHTTRLPKIKRFDLDEIGIELFNSENKLKYLRSLALFPVSEKEMQAFIDFPHLVPFRINRYFDYPRNIHGLSNKKECENLEIIDKMPETNDLKLFDSAILGYFMKNLFEANVRFGYDLLDLLIKQEKNLFLFDKSLYNHIKASKCSSKIPSIYIPQITNKTMEQMLQFRYLRSVKVPVLAVVGTSNRQGKFTTQLRIKEILQKEKYNISHLSTEPQGELLGASFAFPYGFGENINIPRSKWALFLRILMKGLQEFNAPHLILTGTQGWTVPRAANQSAFGNETQTLDFLFGIQPDAIICAINPTDSIEIINNTIKAIQIYTNSKSILLTITPWARELERKSNNSSINNYQYLDRQDLENKIDFYSNMLKLPVINIMDPDSEKLVKNTIQKAFS